MFELFCSHGVAGNILALQELKEKYIRAKALGARANELKAEVATLKASLERHRLSAAAADIAAGGDGQVATGGGDAAASEITATMEACKQEYRACFDELRDHKHAIEHLQKLLEQSRERMAVCSPPPSPLALSCSCSKCAEVLNSRVVLVSRRVDIDGL